MALLSTTHPGGGGSIPASIAALSKGEFYAMFLTTNKRAAAFALSLALLVSAAVLLISQPLAGQAKAPRGPLRVDPPRISTDKTVKYDYDIVYVRAPRFVKGKDGKDHQAQVWPDAGTPHSLKASTDLMLLHPDGSEEMLVAGGQGAIADPYVSVDANWVSST